MVWELILRLGGQMRVIAGMGGCSVIGWDMTAALALGRALGLSDWVMAEVLPEAEAAMVRGANKKGTAGD